MNKEDLLKHRDKLPKDMYVILIKPEGDDNISLAIFDTHSNTKVSTVDLAYTLSRGVLSYLTNDMETIKERGQSVILSELLEFTNLPVTDLLMDRPKTKKHNKKDNITYLFGKDEDDKQ
jgi:hypothetical protein